MRAAARCPGGAALVLEPGGRELERAAITRSLRAAAALATSVIVEHLARYARRMFHDHEGDEATCGPSSAAGDVRRLARKRQGRGGVDPSWAWTRGTCLGR
jgi:hypothetical protein